jgi:hypothetical protein
MIEKKEIFQLYEKLYFHEIDAREKLNSRLQIPLTLIISFVGLLAFLLQNYKHHGFSAPMFFFFVLIVVSYVALALATFFFIKSWWNHTYSFLPSAQVTEDYRLALIEYYENHENNMQLVSEYFSDYLMTHYIRCSSANTARNDLRSVNLHKTNGTLIVTAIIAFVAFLFFFFGNLDKTTN